MSEPGFAGLKDDQDGDKKITMKSSFIRADLSNRK